MNLKTLSIIALVALVAALNWLFPESDETPANIAGSARVIDGDSLIVDGYEVRMVGIDAPEGRQNCQRRGRSWPCGEESSSRLRALINRKTVTCDVEGRDRFGRLLSICNVGGNNLNRAQVRNGWAVSYGRFKKEERMAKANKSGIWSGTFQRPRAWRDKNL